jgi:hypothetical protein
MDYLGSSQSDQFNKTETKPKTKNRTLADAMKGKKTEGEDGIPFFNKQSNLQRCILELQEAIREKDERISTLERNLAKVT